MKKKVLVVDDEKKILELLRIKLSKQNLDVVTAKNAKECWRQAFSQKPDLVILDIWLGEGAFGTQVYDEMLRAGFDSTVPVIFISALVDKDQAPTRAVEGGRYALFGKPIDFKIMLEEVHRLLGEKIDELNAEEEQKENDGEEGKFKPEKRF